MEGKKDMNEAEQRTIAGSNKPVQRVKPTAARSVRPKPGEDKKKEIRKYGCRQRFAASLQKEVHDERE
jgi:hypothetical protein